MVYPALQDQILIMEYGFSSLDFTEGFHVLFVSLMQFAFSPILFKLHKMYYQYVSL
jgi:hypothetical protein